MERTAEPSTYIHVTHGNVSTRFDVERAAALGRVADPEAQRGTANERPRSRHGERGRRPLHVKNMCSGPRDLPAARQPQFARQHPQLTGGIDPGERSDPRSRMPERPGARDVACVRCRIRAVEGQRTDVGDIPHERTRGAAVAKLQRTGGNRGDARVRAVAGQREHAGTLLGERARTADGVRELGVDRLLDDQRRVVVDAAAAEAGRRTRERAGHDGGAAAIGIDAAQRRRARAALADRTCARDRAAEGHGIRAVEGQRAVVGDAAGEAAAGVAVAELQGAAGNGGAARIAVGRGEYQRAAIGLDESPIAGELRGDGGAHAGTRARAVTDANGVGASDQGDRVALDAVSIDAELHACHAHRADGVIHRDRAGCAGEHREGGIQEGAVRRTALVRPVDVGAHGIGQPGARAAGNDCVIANTGIAVPPPQHHPLRVDEIDLAADARLQRLRGAGRHGAQSQCVVRQRAGVVDQAIEPGAVAAAGRGRHIQRAVQRQVAQHFQQVVEGAAYRAGLPEFEVEHGIRTERETAEDRQRAHPTGARRQRAVADDHGPAERAGATQRATGLHRCLPVRRRLVAVDVQAAGVDERRAGIAVGRRERQRAAALLGKRAGAGDEIVQRAVAQLLQHQRTVVEDHAAAEAGGRTPQRAAADHRAAAVAVDAAQRGDAGANLRHRAAARDGTGNCHVVRPVDHQAAVVGQRTGGDVARRAAIAQLQRAGGEDRAAHVGVVCREHQCAVAELGQATRAVDDRRDGEDVRCSVDVDAAATGRQGDRPAGAAVAGAGDFQRAAVEGQSAGGCTEVAIRRDREYAFAQRPGRHRRRRTAQGPGAGAEFVISAEAPVLHGQADLRHIEAGVGAAAQRQYVRGAAQDDTGDGRIGAQLQQVVAAAEGNAIGVERAIGAGSANDAAVVDDDRAARTDDGYSTAHAGAATAAARDRPVVLQRGASHPRTHTAGAGRSAVGQADYAFTACHGATHPIDQRGAPAKDHA